MSQTLEKWREKIAEQENQQRQQEIDGVGGDEYDDEEDVY